MNRLRHEAGQTVVLFAVLLPLFLGLGAIAVDIGYWYVVKKTAQDAADAAALAAARELPNDSSARQVAADYVYANMPDADPPEIEFPYIPDGADTGVVGGGEPDYRRIEVTVTHATGTFFGRLFGLVEPTVSSRAVAERTVDTDNLAIFSDSGLCGDGLRFNAAGVRVNGHIHSNGQFRIDLGPFWAANGTFAVSSGCPASRDAEAVTQFGDDPTATLPLEGVERDWPTWYTPAALGWRTGCTYDAVTIEISSNAVTLHEPDLVVAHEGVIPSGIYCASESLRIDGQNLTGRLTVLSPSITVEGGGLRLRPFAQDVLFFALPNTDTAPNDGPPEGGGTLFCDPADGSDLTLSGSGHRWFGIVFNPCGRIVVNLGGGLDGGPALEGAIIGDRVLVDGDGFEMIGRGDFEYSAALVE